MNIKSLQAEADRRFQAKDYLGALKQYETMPQSPLVCYNIAICHRELGNLETCRDILARLVRTKMKNGEYANLFKGAYVAVMCLYVRQCAQEFNLAKALDANLEAMTVLHNNEILMYNQGHIYKCMGMHKEALECLNKSLIYNPLYFDAYIEKINIYNDAKDYTAAEIVIREGLKTIPSDARFYNELGVCLCRLGRVKDGFDAYEKGLSSPSCNSNVAGKIYTNVGNAYSLLGDIPASIENSKRGYEMDPTNTTAMQNTLMNMLYLSNVPFTNTLKSHFEIGALYSKQKIITDHVVVPYNPARTSEGDKIRIGYVSGDFFGDHPVTYFIKALLTCYNHDRFEIYCYSNHKLGDFPQYDPDIKWRDIKYLETPNVCYMISVQDQIDVLIDLSGHTACNRLDIFSNRCARVQLSYIGYPCITGIPNIDYHVVDKTFDIRIKTIAMPHCFTHYWPDSVPAADTLVSPFHRQKYFCFGTLNKLAKVNQSMVDLWDCILDEFPESRLLIRRNYVFKFRNQDRVFFFEHAKTHKDHLERYNSIDIAFDTAPYSGTTTTCESMLMGTPVITLAERKTKTIQQNVSASLLINSGMNHLVVESIDDYRRVIRRLMEEIKEDPYYKQKVQNKFLEGSVCNRIEYMQDFESMISSLHNNSVTRR
jgi:predicted O-linked N-acetylglucosamine transferase (SPINDLY family)